MAHRQAKQQAFELFQKDFYPPDVAASLGLNIRTCQRWFKEFQGDTVASSQPQKSCSPASVVFAEEDPKKIKAQNDDDEDLDLRGEGWFVFASKLTTNHFRVHNKARKKIEEILNQKLEESEINLRAVHTLSIALARHIEAERVAMCLDYLDIDAAARRLYANGYIITEGEV
jgi:AraC-like DNA-binding protein